MRLRSAVLGISRAAAVEAGAVMLGTRALHTLACCGCIAIVIAGAAAPAVTGVTAAEQCMRLGNAVLSARGTPCSRLRHAILPAASPAAALAARNTSHGHIIMQRHGVGQPRRAGASALRRTPDCF